MFNLFKRKKSITIEKNDELELELTALVLAYEVARSDGAISKSELEVLFQEIKKTASIVHKDEKEIFKILERFSAESVSFHEFIVDINKDLSKDEKLLLINILWTVAFADSVLEVHEERLIRRIADLIHIKDMDVLRVKDQVRKNQKSDVMS
jgi:uncharacterized tellurite resistance protein B-like protein|tara:strand:+ start:346 stop:801 length:456 start_codon:yes stop_codon:yes gene_type:complete